MNQTTVVVDVVEPWHTISRSTVEPTMWQVRAHGDNGFDQLIDLFDTLDEAEEAYPDAVTLPNVKHLKRLIASNDQRKPIQATRAEPTRGWWSDRRYRF